MATKKNQVDGKSGDTASGKSGFPPEQDKFTENGGKASTVQTDTGDIDDSISDVIDELENDAASAADISAVGGGINRPNHSPGVPVNGLNGQVNNIDLLLDVNVTVRVELGRTKKSIEEILNLNPGMLVALDRGAGDNVDLFLNDKLFATGEVTVVDGNFAIRIVQLIGKMDKIHPLLEGR
ncbi:MAG: FliM/FliN family flagellar motor switch protein [Candidatus Krumholzibacteriota bacterium]|nr:FliM/FliN family flagellar motor switch protein [Candidatus Krumholzibacteriota bacterium]